MTSLHAALALLEAAPTDRAAGLAVTRTGRAPGSAPTLVLLHGLGGARVHWAPVLPALTERYDVLVVDLPGHGASEPLPATADARAPALARRVAAALTELGVERPHLAGNSLGGWTGLELAADGVLASLTALAPAGLRLVPGEPSPLLRVNRALARTLGRFTDPLVSSSLIRRVTYASGTADPAGLDPDFARAIARALRDSTAYEQMLRATRHIRFERRAHVEVPVTVVFGDRDRILPARGYQHPEMAPPHCRWIVLAHCGHAPMWDATAATLRLIDETVTAGSAGRVASP